MRKKFSCDNEIVDVVITRKLAPKKKYKKNKRQGRPFLASVEKKTWDTLMTP